ncbi:hypothetical protein CCMA1212_008285 [Trichoderma ghanense]|uniref:Uncharacterized protein n=1 Tax=Trichoderma ghanense TaxID=65468 RepID=A0ABY2GX65_9HYPO
MTASSFHRRAYDPPCLSHHRRIAETRPPARSLVRNSTQINSTRQDTATNTARHTQHLAHHPSMPMPCPATQATFSLPPCPVSGLTLQPKRLRRANHDATPAVTDTARQDPSNPLARRAFLHSAPAAKGGSDPCAIARGSARGGLSLADAFFLCVLLS